MARYKGQVSRIYFRGDAGFANPEIYDYLEAEGVKYVIRLATNRVLQERIGHLLTRPLGRPPHEVRRYYASFGYQAGSWTKPRRVVAKVEWHPGELCPRIGFIVTNMSRRAEKVIAFYNKSGTCEQWIKEGKGAINWTRLSCRSFAANAVRLQLHALAYNLGNFLRTLATPEPIKDWTLTTLKEKLIKIGAKVASHGRYVAFQMAEVAIPRGLFADILRMLAELRLPPLCVNGIERSRVMSSSQTTGEVRPNDTQFCEFRDRRTEAGRPFTILRSGRAFRDGCTLSEIAPETEPIRRIPDKRDRACSAFARAGG